MDFHRSGGMNIAVQGCSHGCLTEIYDTIAESERRRGIKVDLLLCCGDFQALRNEHDFASLAVPPKYRELGSFHEYYSGVETAPVLTVVIGGNHECSAYMWELYHGGWLAPNIYYLGAAGSVIVNGIRISGASGIYKSHDYTTGHHERVPYDQKSVKSAYHVRSYDVDRLRFLSPAEDSETTDIFMSHDWPVSITRYGNEAKLLKAKPFFAEEVRTNTLGSPPMLELLHSLRPSFWFSAHLHVKFSAYVKHNSEDTVLQEVGPSSLMRPASTDDAINMLGDGPANPDEIDLDDDEEDGEEEGETAHNPDEIDLVDTEEEPEDSTDVPDGHQAKDHNESMQTTAQEAPSNVDESIEKQPPDALHERLAADEASAQAAIATSATDITNKSSSRTTRFLALDKCLPHRHFMQIIEVPVASPKAPAKLQFDVEWLAITKVTHPYLPLKKYGNQLLPPPEALKPLIQETAREIRSTLDARQAESVDAEVNPYDVLSVQKFWPTAPTSLEGGGPDAWYTNPQTEALCQFLGIPNLINPAPFAE